MNPLLYAEFLLNLISVKLNAMSSPKSNSEEPIIPWSAVFVIIGTIILMTVCIIWLLVPTSMPQVVYDLFVGSAPAPIAQFIPTRAMAATVPTPPPVMLLPDEELSPSSVAVPTAVSVNNPPLHISIPAIGLDAPIAPITTTAVVYNGQTYQQWNVPDGHIAGWHQNSATVGSGGNMVLNGHHNINGEVFRDLVDLEKGDKLILTDDDGEHIYQVTEKEILAERGQPISVRLENAARIAPTADRRITLITCWPYTDNSHRLVIVAKPIGD